MKALFFSGLAYPLAAQQFFHEFGEKFKFEVTQVIGLTNDDAVSKEFRPYKQLIERLIRTYKASYRPSKICKISFRLAVLIS